MVTAREIGTPTGPDASDPAILVNAWPTLTPDINAAIMKPVRREG